MPGRRRRSQGWRRSWARGRARRSWVIAQITIQVQRPNCPGLRRAARAQPREVLANRKEGMLQVKAVQVAAGAQVEVGLAGAGLPQP